MPQSHPKKRFFGLCGQDYATSQADNSYDTDHNAPEHMHQHAETSNDQHKLKSDDQACIDIAFDGLKVNFEKEYENETDDESDLDKELELEILKDEEFGQRLVALVKTEEGRYLDWIPEQLCRKGKNVQ